MAAVDAKPVAPDIAHHAALDARLVTAVRGIRLLESVSWPQAVQHQFLEDWRKGQHALPAVTYVKEDH
jgi:hypothetical protein